MANYESWKNPIVATVMGSDSDLGIMQEAPAILDMLGVPNMVDIVSAHRTPDLLATFGRAVGDESERVEDFDLNSYAIDLAVRGVKVVIAGAGGAAHLPGMTAAFARHVPTIGVPVMSSPYKSDAAPLSIEEMPPGVVVATMAINGAKNAGILAAQILGTSHPEFSQAVENYRKELEAEVMAKRRLLRQEGYVEYEERRTGQDGKKLGIPKTEDGVGRGGFLPGSFVSKFR